MPTFWIVVERNKGVLAIAAILAPYVGGLLGLVIAIRPSPLGPARVFGRAIGRGIAVGVFAMPVLLYLAFCSPPPGEGVAANEGKRHASTIIAELEQFHSRTGAYPDSLAQLSLAPAATALAGSTDQWPLSRFEYRRDSIAFRLGFTYVGPGSNRCEYRASRGGWRCGGYY